MSADLAWSRAYPHSTTMLPAMPMHGSGGAEIFDAANECAHGRLPTDKPENRAKVGCTCWDANGVLVEAPRRAPASPAVAEVRTPIVNYGEIMAQLQSSPATEPRPRVYLDASPFIANTLADIAAREDELRDELAKLTTLKKELIA